MKRTTGGVGLHRDATFGSSKLDHPMGPKCYILNMPGLERKRTSSSHCYFFGGVQFLYVFFKDGVGV